jgi:pimeloyl-ACP methyl ester carboxylesterase
MPAVTPVSLFSRSWARGATQAALPPTARRTAVVSHGFMGSSLNWGAAAASVSGAPLLRGCLDGVTAVDMRNHGASPHSAVQTPVAMSVDLEHFIADPAADADAAADAAEGGPRKVVLIGHSMGGIAAMTTALRVANGSALHCSVLRERVVGVVIVDVCPIIRTTATFDKITHDLDCLLDLPMTPSLSLTSADLMLREAIPDKQMRMFLLTNLKSGSVKDDVAASWKCNLDVLRGSLTMLPFAPADMRQHGGPLARVDLPTLFVFGERSEYNHPAGRAEVGEYFSSAEQVVIAGSGHYPHFEKRDEFVAAVAPFMRRVLE